ncbi:hypothetical protein AMECASPLE_028242 [Ameca splendens]|uniref:Uncharacterized protein n=1 Tax=Ameca splendens TaxID=208324 RepID=A0ABV0ZF05_9TELE
MGAERKTGTAQNTLQMNAKGLPVLTDGDQKQIHNNRKERLQLFRETTQVCLRLPNCSHCSHPQAKSGTASDRRTTAFNLCKVPKYCLLG